MKLKIAAALLSLSALAGMQMVMTGCWPHHSQATLPQTALPLTATQWTLNLDSLTGLTEPLDQPHNPITLEIAEDGKVFGSAGVNNYRCRVDFPAEPESIVFGMAATTRMAGPGLAYEMAYLKMLGEARKYSISGNQLLLLNAQDQVVAAFTGTPAAAATQP